MHRLDESFADGAKLLPFAQPKHDRAGLRGLASVVEPAVGSHEDTPHRRPHFIRPASVCGGLFRPAENRRHLARYSRRLHVEARGHKAHRWHNVPVDRVPVTEPVGNKTISIGGIAAFNGSFSDMYCTWQKNNGDGSANIKSKEKVGTAKTYFITPQNVDVVGAQSEQPESDSHYL